jgi:hypothetical protein
VILFKSFCIKPDIPESGNDFKAGMGDQGVADAVGEDQKRYCGE